jgi:CubicO group peptidase (beta-lactamase class C family)
MKSINGKIGIYRFHYARLILRASLLVLAFVCFQATLLSQAIDVTKRLDGFDSYMNKTLKDWNIAGACVGIVYKDKLVYAKGYGYRDYGQKVPVTPKTLYQIASNTKLFTAVAVGMLVEQGKLDWDKPVRNYVPSIDFYNNELNNTVTIRDMLSHRTGISRHDLIWYKSDFSRKDLYDRLKYLEPSQPLRQGFLYNNLMYVASGYIIELLSSKPWENFLQENILNPLEMKNTVFTVKEMEQNSDHGVPYNEKRDTTILYQIPIYEDQQAVGPAGAIISNIEEMSNWLVTLMNNGKFKGNQIIPEKIIKETLQPSIALPNSGLEDKGYKEILNAHYGMGRFSASYRGKFLTYHGGDLPGFHSQISAMPYDSIGVVVFVIGDQGAPLYNIISYNIYERLLGLDLTPWSERLLKDQMESKKIGKEGRSKSGSDRITGTKPSHNLIDYIGQYENPAYGTINITLPDTALQFDFHNMKLPLKHYHYDRFDTPNDEQWGLWTLNFTTNPQGSIDALYTSLDESQTTFTRKADASLSDPLILANYTGKYSIAGNFINVELIDKNLYLVSPGQPRIMLIPVKQHSFRVKEFPDLRFEFMIENGVVTGFKQIDPSGEYKIEKQK